MMPTTLLFIVSFAFLLFPSNNPGGLSAIKEGAKINPALSLNLNLNSVHSNGTENKQVVKSVKQDSEKSSLELPPEVFTESSVELESWMSSPVSWGKK